MKSPSMATPVQRVAARNARAGAAMPCSTPAASEEHGGLWAHSTPEAFARAAGDLLGTDAAPAIEWCALSGRKQVFLPRSSPTKCLPPAKALATDQKSL